MLWPPSTIFALDLSLAFHRKWCFDLLDLYKGIDVWENKLHKWTEHWHALRNSRVTCNHCFASKSNECHLNALLWKCTWYWFPEVGQDEWMHFVSKSRYQYVFVIGFDRCLEVGCDAMQFGKRQYSHNGANTFTHTVCLGLETSLRDCMAQCLRPYSAPSHKSELVDAQSEVQTLWKRLSWVTIQWF